MKALAKGINAGIIATIRLERKRSLSIFHKKIKSLFEVLTTSKTLFIFSLFKKLVIDKPYFTTDIFLMLEYRTKMGKLIKIPTVIKTFGNSMYPLLLDGDILYLKKIKFSKIRVNDIITAKDSIRYFTHRVIYKGKNYVVTKGDNNPITDKKVYAKDIIGRVENVKRQGNIFNPEQIYLLQSSLYF